MKCCTRNEIVPADPRFSDDDFTSAALAERQTQAAHSHAAAAVLAGLAGLVIIGLAGAVFGRRS